MEDPNKVIGVRPIRLKPLIRDMILSFMHPPYETRIFEHLSSAILIPVTVADKHNMGLVQIGTTNTYRGPTPTSGVTTIATITNGANHA